KSKLIQAAIAVAALTGTIAHAQVKVGMIVSATGAAASLGTAQKKALPLMPTELGGAKVDYIVLDAASDTNSAVKAARKLMADEKVDVVIGPSLPSTSLAVIDVAAETRTPLISMASSSRITSPMDDKRHWVFKTAMSEDLAAAGTLKHAKSIGIKRLAVIAASDAYGDSWVQIVGPEAKKAG